MKITVIFTGGTIGSKLHGDKIGTDAAAPHELLCRYADKTGRQTVFKTAEPYTILSENLTLAHLAALAKAIKEESRDADGIIVTHGTDTLPYTAAALSYLLGLCKVPVVLVSSNYVLSDSRANGVANFAAAVAFLENTPHARGVFVSYQNKGDVSKIHRASRLLAHLAPTDTVRSLDGVVATYKDGKIYPVSAYLEKEDGTAPLESATPKSIEGNSLFLRVHPGMLYPTPPENTRAVLFEAYHSGTLPTADAAFADFTSMLQGKGIPTFVTGITGEAVYESTTAFEGLGLIPLPRMSPLAAYMKLTLTLAAGLDPKEILPLSLGGDLAPQGFDRKEKQ